MVCRLDQQRGSVPDPRTRLRRPRAVNRSPAHSLVVLHAPAHGPSLTRHHIRRALGLGACSIGWSEAYRRIDYLRGRPSWRLTVAWPSEAILDDPDERRGAWDCPISTRRHHDRLAAFRVRACDESTPIKLAPPRYVYGEAYAHPLGDVEHIAAHPNAAVVNRETGEPLNPREVDRVAKYVETMAVVERRARHALNRNRLVVITGDLQMGAHQSVPWSPSSIAKRLDLRVWAEGIDYVLSDKRLKPVDRRVIHTTMDHPWMREEFTRA